MELNKIKNSRLASFVTAIVLLAAVPTGMYLNKTKNDHDIDIKTTIEQDYENSSIDELLDENIDTKEYIYEIDKLLRYLELSKQLNSMGILKTIDIKDIYIADSILLEPIDIKELIPLANKQPKIYLKQLKEQEALINDYIYDFAYKKAPLISEVITKAQIIDADNIEEDEISFLTLTGYESYSLNDDFNKKIAYITGEELYATTITSDLGKFRKVSLDLEKNINNETYLDSRHYNEERNKNVKDFIKYMNRVLLNDYKVKPRVTGHGKVLIRTDK